jgi:hypothetical protein
MPMRRRSGAAFPGDGVADTRTLTPPSMLSGRRSEPSPPVTPAAIELAITRVFAVVFLTLAVSGFGSPNSSAGGTLASGAPGRGEVRKG